MAAFQVIRPVCCYHVSQIPLKSQDRRDVHLNVPLPSGGKPELAKSPVHTVPETEVGKAGLDPLETPYCFVQNKWRLQKVLPPCRTVSKPVSLSFASVD